ncbi:MAG: CopG family transcriptional regulator [archaeon]
MEKDREYGTVSLPMPLINSIKEKIKGTGMHSVSAYICFILRQILSSPDSIDGEVLDKKTEREIKNRLEKLGYI